MPRGSEIAREVESWFESGVVTDRARVLRLATRWWHSVDPSTRARLQVWNELQGPLAPSAAQVDEHSLRSAGRQQLPCRIDSVDHD